MDSFEPLINLSVLMTALSVAAERLANVIKLRNPRLRSLDVKERERQIGNRVLVLSLALALIVKADFIAILSALDAPWDTLGWSRAAFASPADLLATLAGIALTGILLGFGSKFWHDVLDVVHGARRMRVEGERRTS